MGVHRIYWGNEFYKIEPFIAQNLSGVSVILLFNVGIVALMVGARTGKLEDARPGLRFLGKIS
jgi:hypothetical protein